MSLQLDAPVPPGSYATWSPIRGRHRTYRAAQVSLLLVAIALLYLANIGGHPLQDPDEGRYAEIPREMIEAGDYLTPRLNYVEYFEKPPLLYWLVAGSFHAFGPTEGAARLVPSIAGLGTLLVTFLATRRFFGGQAAFVAAAVLATTPLFFVFSQALVIDMLLTLLLTACMTSLWCVRQDPEHRLWPLAAASTAALAVLAKGVVGLLLPGLVLVMLLAIERDWRTLRALVRPAPIATFLVIATPWFALMAARHPAFLHEFFIVEHLQRFATDRVGHPEPAWFYAPVLAAGALPWTLLAFGLAASPDGRAAWRSLPQSERRFAIVWVLTILVFFSAARSKLPGYVIPVLPPAAMLFAAWLDRVDPAESRGARLTLRLTAGLLALVGILLLVAGLFLPSVVETLASGSARLTPADTAQIRLVALCSGLAAMLGSLWLLPHDRSSTGSMSTILLEIAVTMVLLLSPLVAARGLAKSSQGLAAAIAREATPGDLVVQHRTLLQGLSFYLRQRVVLVGDAGEISSGAERASDRADYFWEDIEPLEREWASERRVFVATLPRHLPELRARLVPAPQVIAESGGRVVVSNRPPE